MKIPGRIRPGILSGRWDLNPGPLQPHCSALAGLRHAPNSPRIIAYSRMDGKPDLSCIILALHVAGKYRGEKTTYNAR
jgi:hypothetical protein